MATNNLPALPAIIAKVMVLVEEVLDCFVNVGYTTGTESCCDYGGTWVGNTTICGDALATDLSALIAQIMNMAGQVVSSLMVEIQTIP